MLSKKGRGQLSQGTGGPGEHDYGSPTPFCESVWAWRFMPSQNRFFMIGNPDVVEAVEQNRLTKCIHIPSDIFPGSTIATLTPRGNWLDPSHFQLEHMVFGECVVMRSTMMIRPGRLIADELSNPLPYLHDLSEILFPASSMIPRFVVGVPE